MARTPHGGITKDEVIFRVSMKLQKFFSILQAVVSIIALLGIPAFAENPGRPKVGLALGGGGTRGLAHLAVLRELEKEGIPIDCIAGTSMGAIIGGMYSAGLSIDQIEKLFRDKSLMHSYDTVPIPVRLSLIPIFFVPHLFGYHPYDGLYRGNKFANYINGHVALDQRDLECLKIPFCAVGSNLLDGKAHAITTGNIGRALQASSAIPGLRKPVSWQGKLFVDGGVVANVPVKQCRDMGADIVIAVDVDEHLNTVDPNMFRKIGSVSFRCVNMHLAKLDEPQLKNADIIIHPNVDGITLLSRDMKDIDLALKAGQEATRKAIPIIQERLNGQLCKTDSEGKS